MLEVYKKKYSIYPFHDDASFMPKCMRVSGCWKMSNETYEKTLISKSKARLPNIDIILLLNHSRCFKLYS